MALLPVQVGRERNRAFSSLGDDLRRLPLSMRKANLSRLLARRVDGIFLSDFEQGGLINGYIDADNR
jgi:hypothetical protein